MQCEWCHEEMPEGSVRCPKCKMPITQTVEEFDNTKKVQQSIHDMMTEWGEKIANTQQLIGYVCDYLSDWDRERIVLVKMLKAGALDEMMAGDDRKQAVSNSRDLMLNAGAKENEAEFVLAVLASMLKLPYISPLAVSSEEKKEEDKKDTKEKPVVLEMDSKIFKKFDAIRFRLSKVVNIKEGYTMIDAYCFDGFGKIRTVNLPDTMMCIGEYAFTDCKHLTEVNLPASVKKIEKGAFNACLSLTDVNIPEGVLELGDNTFLCCSALEELIIPETVSGFGENCFSGCDNLKMLSVPQSVKYIGENCFLYCPQLVIYCYENSYVHKYCLQKKIKFKTTPLGSKLPTELKSESGANNKEEQTK